ncbi:MAG TPA: T9SS type A sorting domain-containing protein [Candidatus Kryptonia bacterium]
MRSTLGITVLILVLWCTGVVKSQQRSREDHDAIKYVKLVPAELKSLKYTSSTGRLYRTQSATWTTLGPQPINMEFNTGVSSGRVASLAVDPTNANIVYAAAAGGGLWKTTDGGTTWNPLTDDLPRLASGSVAVDQTNDQIVYYGQGELHFSIDSYPGSGFYMSTDGGTTWAQIHLPGSLYYTGKVEVAPSDHNVVYTCGYYDIYKSTDAGQSWGELNLTPVDSIGYAGAVQDLAVDPTNASVVYAVKGSSFSDPFDTSFGVFKSINGGTSWTRTSAGLPASKYITRISIAAAPNNNQVLYVGINGTNPLKPSSDTTRAFKTTDGGSSWTVMQINSDYGGGQGWYNNMVAVDPTNASVVYVGGIDLWKSTDGGSTWTNLTKAYSTGNVHPDQHALSFMPGTGNFFLGDDGGVWKTTDGGTTFSDCNTNLQVTQFYAVGIDASNSSLTYAGAQDNGTDRNISPSNNWSEIYSGDGGYVTVDPTNSNIVYGEYVNGALVRSMNGGSGFSPIVTGLNGDGYWTTPYQLDPNNTSILYTATDRAYKTTNKGTNWSAVSAAVKGTGDLVTTMALSAAEPNVLYAGISGYRGGDAGSFLYVSQDSGKTWMDITINGDSTNDFARVTADPTQKGVAYLAMLQSPEVMKTTNYGTSWTPIGSTSNGFNGEPAKYICVDSTTGYIYAGTYDGVYITTNGGGTWSKLGTGLPNAVVDDIAIQYATHSLRVATHGRGGWEVDLATGIARSVETPTEFSLAQNYPNPFNPATTISFKLAADSYVTLKVYDVLGREVATLMKGKQKAGEHSLTFDASKLTSGVYFYRIATSSFTETRKMILVK